MQVREWVDAFLAEAYESARAVVEAFASKNSSLLTTAGSFDKCKATAWRLKDLLDKNGFPATVWSAVGYNGEWRNANPKWLKMPTGGWMHYVAESGGLVFDLTARQFNPSAPAPMYLTLDEFKQQWVNVYEEG